MLGLIFEATRMVISSQFGEDAWDSLLEASGVEVGFSSLGNYSATDLDKVVETASSEWKQSPEEILRMVGEGAYGHLHQSALAQVADIKSSRELFDSLEHIIHSRVRSLHPHSNPPKFRSEQNGEHLELVYQSHRGLCHLAEGLAKGATKHFGEEALVEQTECGRGTGSPCRIRITYT